MTRIRRTYFAASGGCVLATTLAVLFDPRLCILVVPAYASVAKTHRCVVVQEQWKPFGAGAEIAASIMENAFDDLDAPIERVCGEDVPMPYARNLELLATPHEEQVSNAVKRALYRD